MTESVYRHIARGASWAIAMRWGIRVIGLASTVILARILTPADFGLVAMAMLSVALIETFMEMWAGLMLIRERGISQADCDTAWTLRIFQGIFVAVVVLCAAPVAQWYFSEPAVVPIMQLAAVTCIVDSFQSAGLVLARRNLDFALDFRYHVYQRVLKFVATIALALWWRSYWALVVGNLVGALLSVGLSYAMTEYRPRVCLTEWQKFLRFSITMMTFNVSRYFNETIDSLVVGGLASATRFGVYNMAADIAKMLTLEITIPVGRALLPSYSSIAADRPALARAYLTTVNGMVLVLIPLAFGLHVVSADFVRVVLGAKWVDSIVLLELLAFYALMQGLISALGGQIFIVTGHERWATRLSWCQFALVGSAVVATGHTVGIEAIPVAAAVMLALQAAIVARTVTTILPVTLGQLVLELWRPVFGAVVMVLVVTRLHAESAAPALRLALDVLVGVVVYPMVVAITWHFAGRPDGTERLLAAAIAARWRARDR